jgi:hypothetical protein
MVPAFLLMLPVVVVHVTGDRLDPTHTRELVAHELAVDAVAPDDPRASDATGRIVITTDAEGRKLTVRYRKRDEPVERTIDLASDRTRAESDAALLAGNLARDESAELTPPKENAKPVAQTPVDSPADDETDLARMRAFLVKSQEDEHTSRMRIGITAFAVSAAIAAPTVYFYAAEDVSKEGEIFRSTGAFLAGLAALGGVLSLSVEMGTYEPLGRKVQEMNARGDKPSRILAEVESDWEKTAKKQRWGRHFVGWMCVGLGTVFTGLATVATFADGPRSEGPPVTPILYLTGGAMLISGVAFLSVETEIESTYRMWRTVRRGPSQEARSPFSIGAAPLPGGGGASFAMTF